jgi:malate/lactate dehydrogenase
MPDVTRIGIIGTGWVGSSVAISTLHAGVAQELLLHDEPLPLGEAADQAKRGSTWRVTTRESCATSPVAFVTTPASSSWSRTPSMY